MNEQTENLAGTLLNVLDAAHHAKSLDNGKGTVALRDLILTSCKEAGLKFVPAAWNKPFVHVGSYLSVKGGDQKLAGFDLGVRRSFEEVAAQLAEIELGNAEPATMAEDISSERQELELEVHNALWQLSEYFKKKEDPLQYEINRLYHQFDRLRVIPEFPRVEK